MQFTAIIANFLQCEEICFFARFPHGIKEQKGNKYQCKVEMKRKSPDKKTGHIENV